MTAAMQISVEGLDKIPQTDLGALRTTACRMLEEMEEQRQILDRSAVRLGSIKACNQSPQSKCTTSHKAVFAHDIFQQFLCRN